MRAPREGDAPAPPPSRGAAGPARPGALRFRGDLLRQLRGQRLVPQERAVERPRAVRHRAQVDRVPRDLQLRTSALIRERPPAIVSLPSTRPRREDRSDITAPT